MPLITGALISGGVSFVSGIFGAASAKRQANEAKARADAAQLSLNSLINSRQDVINPYDEMTDLSSMLSNPMANLSVATQAAEMQVEQADISLANTLDTIRATGSSAGGATALANAALKSKKGVSASIEAQEAQNEKMKAQGEANLQRQQMAEKQRLQQANAAGRQFKFSAQENRDTAQMDRLSAQISGAQQQEAQANANASNAITGMVGSLASIGGSYMNASAGVTASENAMEEARFNAMASAMNSDRRLKKDINKTGVSKKGLNIYSFKYINESKYGQGIFQGVMSDEIPKEAVIKDEDGYDKVDYSKLDVEFKKISNEL